MNDSNRGFIFTVIGVVAVIIAAITVFIITGTQKEREAQAPIPEEAIAGDRMEVTDDTVTLGNPEAPVTVTIYEDFGCPLCRQFERESGPDLRQYIQGDDVKVEYKLISVTNSGYPNDYSEATANFMYSIAQNSHRDWSKLHDDLYFGDINEEEDLTPYLMNLATEQGVDNYEQIRTDVEEGTYVEQVQANTTQAIEDGVPGTPYVLVNDEPIEALEADALENAVSEAIPAK